MQNVNIGDRLIVGDLPQFMPAEPISLMIQGETETLKNVTWDISWNTTPYGPYLIGQLNTAVTGGGLRAATDTSSGTSQTQLAAAATSTATSLSIKTLSGPTLSANAADYPGDVFFADPNEGRRCFRLGFSSIRAERIETGLRRLGELAR